jgi:hypothetical protein
VHGRFVRAGHLVREQLFQAVGSAHAPRS